ncbi:hypothetical protein [Brevundimonas sp. A19_0]|uniref:hypothetical protein n=1 Tax=Brevundimonas sp. A19_0 TaxID=2821087 RepID=UPI001ADAA5CF|nr:hypothetical protein [Brevundimonas sp. A19_0]MBO9500420.1 hypothetical protein [Brevundimonas sp. A19_0]
MSTLNEMGQSRAGRRVAELFAGLSDPKRAALLAVAEALAAPTGDESPGAATT